MRARYSRNDVFVVADAIADDRFCDNPLVVNDPKIRFYAGCPLRSLEGHKLGTLCIYDTQPRRFEQKDAEILRDLALMVERELAAVRLATVDELTHIPNRRGFRMLAEQALRLCARQNMPASLVFMDLDKFKSINDTYGHAEGDRALRTFAAQMIATYRESDLFARLGGDEFVALLTDTTQALAEALIERLRQSLEQAAEEAGEGYHVAFSHGVVEYDPAQHRTIDALLSEGDKLMYTVKKAKR
ncbi:sensor domain-containing diguanylate cyclase [Alkalilimnicola ehrlichii]|uniref:sensor domain-containing diguanylate cyclase n=1 Tax=Alkalilimnicola ehrlichii TaxID=351052 RepID=UPI001C6EF614|nr:sensor domain-containing diguanylate cyclase [Alkalilimnicola ehrlichii]